MIFFLYYLIIGVIWSSLWDLFKPDIMNEPMRWRLSLFWPITLIIWIVAVFSALIGYIRNR